MTENIPDLEIQSNNSEPLTGRRKLNLEYNWSNNFRNFWLWSFSMENVGGWYNYEVE